MLCQSQSERWVPALGFLLGFLALVNPWPTTVALPFREGLVLCLAVAAGLPAARRDGLWAWPGAGLPATLVVVLVALSGVWAPSLGKAVGEVAQLAVYVVALPILVQSASIPAPALAAGLCGGALANLGSLWLGALWSGDWSGTPATGNRLVHGVMLAAVVPFAVLLLQQAPSLRRRTGLGLAGAVAAGMTVTSLPAGVLCLLALANAAWRWCRPRRLALAMVVAWALALACTALHLAPAAARRSVARRDDQGRWRRWVQEIVAGRRAIPAAPFRGHGLGRYQEVVSAGAYRRDLPRPSETKVEPGMEPGLLVLAVESGLPAAAAMLALLASAALPRRRGSSSPADPFIVAARQGVLCLGAGLLLTVVNARSGGIVCGVLLGLARRGAPDPTGTRGLRALPQAAILVLALGLMLLGWHINVRIQNSPAGLAAPADPDAFAVVLSADQATAVDPGVARRTETGTASQQILDLPDLSLPATPPDHLATWSFSTPRPLRAALWFRVWWQDGCGNSLAAGVDGQAPQLLGNDGTYRAWHWVRGPEVELTAGPHVLTLAPREDGIRLDQILITSALAAVPRGALAADGTERPAMPPPTAATALPAVALAARPAPFLIGVGGCYQGGFTAALLAMGLPWGKVNDSDLSRPERLAPFTIICLSETKDLEPEPLYAALRSFVENGGTLVHENCTGRVPGEFRRNLLFFPTAVNWHPEQAYGATLRTDDAAVFTGLAPGSRFALRDDVPYLRQHGTPGPDWTGYGTVVVYGRDDGAAVWERQLGKGRVVYSRIPFSFHTMWRGPALLPPLKSLLAALAHGRGTPVAPLPAPEPPALPADSLTDDFMRAGPALGPSWSVSGTASCTGERGPAPHTEFSLLLESGARVTANQPLAAEGALAAAVFAAHGSGGIWVAIADGELRWLAENGTTARLDRLGSAGTATIGRVPLPDGGGWQRLALVLRNGACEAFIDGARGLRLPEVSAAAAPGSFGVLCEAGRLFVDDVSGRPAAALQEGTDRALGDEGSAQAWGGLSQRGIERDTVYSLRWHLRASPRYANALDLGLPNYLPGTLLGNGTAIAAVAAGSIPASVALPAPTASLHHLAFACAGWRDYVFSGRLTDWFGTGADWVPLARWSCDPEWYWLGAETRQQAALWYRHPLAPPYAISAVVSVGARNSFAEEYSRGRDLNLALGAAGTNLASAVVVRAMNAADRGIEVWQAGQLLQRFPDLGLPSGHSLHHNWFEITALAEAGRLRLRFEGRDLGEVLLPTPLTTGRAAVWTENNSIRVARVTLALAPTP